MVNKSENRRSPLFVLEIAFVAVLAWIVLTSDGAFWRGETVQAGNLAADRQNAETPQKNHKSKGRHVPPEGIPEAASTELLAQVGTPLACQGFDFANGDPQGFTVLAAPGTPLGTPLWHVTNNLCRANLAGHSTPFDFYYGQDGTCNYNDGARNASNLISPSINLSTTFPPYQLGFNYLLFVESSASFDTTFVDISTNNGMTWTQVLSKANLINDNQWHNKVADITALVGSAASVTLRFRFDSVDNLVNSSTGWHVDDVVICGNPFNACVQDDSSGSVLQYNSATGAYLFNDCHGVLVSGTASLLVRGSTTTLQDYGPDRRVLAKIDRSVNKASASVQLFSPSRVFTITDRNTADDTCSCP
jgi:hypothetical protein